MFSRFTAVIFHALPLLAAAATTGSCPDKHTLRCCNSAADASEGLVQGLLDSLGLEGITGLVGLGCGDLLSPTGCTGKSLCCSGNSGDLVQVAVGCISVGVDL
ncbi:hypothetical protein E4T56_gene9254 [Termitomyces sp. T112]|nr:hypothetical protein C0989_002829 [Termitomyces sp. Mn162]KAG5732092.1 hypothetical protein E4T56_gene9254 [Termitomyces sp. T112]